MATTDFIWARVDGHGALVKTALNTDTTDMTIGQCVKLDATNVLSGTPYLTAPGVLIAGAAVFPYGVVVTKAATRTAYKRRGMGKEEVRSKNPLKASKKAAAGRG